MLYDDELKRNVHELFWPGREKKSNMPEINFKKEQKKNPNNVCGTVAYIVQTQSSNIICILYKL